MTATSEDVDVDVDLEKGVPCEQDDCDSEATWKGTTVCCHATAVVCDRCRVRLTKSVEAALADTKTEYVCAYCERPLMLVVWTPL